MAQDAFVNKNGVACKSPATEYLDRVGMFEMQLTAAKLVKTVPPSVHKAQCGKGFQYDIPGALSHATET